MKSLRNLKLVFCLFAMGSFSLANAEDDSKHEWTRKLENRVWTLDELEDLLGRTLVNDWSKLGYQWGVDHDKEYGPPILSSCQGSDAGADDLSMILRFLFDERLGQYGPSIAVICWGDDGSSPHAIYFDDVSLIPYFAGSSVSSLYYDDVSLIPYFSGSSTSSSYYDDVSLVPYFSSSPTSSSYYDDVSLVPYFSSSPTSSSYYDDVSLVMYFR